ncbi:F-box/kelch-repeat protein At3g23880-like [Silene latifolia]|uniref:F-box/kelch-repeat protein At3g23880-like n=1 Tax=Silene latifolia TaxID=37657 RepID=UPI003D76BE7C
MRHKQPPIARKKKQVNELLSYISDDLIIEEILTRLPVKSVLRFKSVSKQWYTTLSSSDFANAHLNKSPFFHPSAPLNTLFIKSGKNYYLSYTDDPISGNFEDNLVKLDSELWVENERLVLTGCCNGLVCLTAISKKYFIIWNPATRKTHKYQSDGCLNLSGSVINGFGYSSSVDDYKYVHIVRDFGKQCNSGVYIFSLRENKWRKFDFDHDVTFQIGRPVIINEKLYCVAHCSQAGPVTLSFDFRVETVELIKGGGFHLGVMGGCLSKCNSFREDDMVMHIFESDALVKSISLPKELIFDMSSNMIGFTRTGKFFATWSSEDEVEHIGTTTVGIVDANAKPVQYTRLLTFNETVTIARYVPSLVSPFPIVEELSTA